MKKIAAFLLTAVLIIVACFSYGASAATIQNQQQNFNEFYNGGSATWQTNRTNGVERWGASVGLVATAWSEHYATVALKPNTTYVFNAAFHNLDAGKEVELLYGENGFAIAPGTYTGSKSAIVNGRINSGSFNQKVPAGQTYGYITNQTFTTTDEIYYTFMFAFTGNSQGRMVLEGCRLTEVAPAKPFKALFNSGSAVWTSNRVNGVERWQSSVGFVVSPWAEHYATVSLKPHTTYVFNAAFRNLDTNSNVNFNYGAYGFAIAPATFTGNEIVANNIISSGTFDVSVPSGQTYGYIRNQTFTTSDETQYTLRFGLSGTSAGGRVVLENCTLTEIRVTPTIASGVALSRNFKSTNTAAIRTVESGKPQGIRVKTTIDTSILGELACGNATVVEYGTLAARTANLMDLDLTMEMVDTGFKVKKGVAYSADSDTDVVYSLDGTTKTFTGVLINIPVNYYTEEYTVRSYAVVRESDGTESVYYTAPMQISVEKVAQAILSSPDASEIERQTAQGILDSIAGQ